MTKSSFLFVAWSFLACAAASHAADPAATPLRTNIGEEPIALQSAAVKVVKREPGIPAKEMPSLPARPKARPSVNTRITDQEPPANVPETSKRPAGPVGWDTAPLGLPRLAPEGSRPESRMSADKFEIDGLEMAARAKGVRKSKQGKADYIDMDGGNVWSRKLRGKPTAVVFVSFLLSAGIDTEISAGGARLRIQTSSFSGYAEVAVAEPETNGGTKWTSINYFVRVGMFGERALALLPVFTLRIDPANQVWDLYTGTHQVIDNRPLMAAGRGETRSFAIVAGAKGALLSGVVLADENPLFDDANTNGIRDEFELKHAGGLLSPDASVVERREVAEAWKIADPRSAPPILNITRPQPEYWVPAQLPLSR